MNNRKLNKKTLSLLNDVRYGSKHVEWIAAFQTILKALKVPVKSDAMLKAALKQPSIFQQKPETVRNNIIRSAKLLGLTSARFAMAALKQPSLFYQKPSTLYGNVTESARLLGLTPVQFVVAATKQPQLFCQKPETLYGNILESARLLGLTPVQFATSALKQPQLFYQRPETINRNVSETARLLEVTSARFAIAALRQPPLFCQKPETLFGNVTESAKLLGLTPAQFVTAALKQPQYFYQKPKTLYRKALYLRKIADVLGANKDFASLIRATGFALCYSTKHLLARYIVAKLGLKGGAVSTLVLLPSAKVDELILAYCCGHIHRTGKDSHMLQKLHAKGIIFCPPANAKSFSKSR